MVDALYDRINDYAAVKIRLASPDDIRRWSYGEVKKPETINYRTYRSEKDGLFCEKIFGPERDWECFCQKYKGIKHKGIKCDRCGVEITHSRVRRSRMGHINLAAPVAHIWFFKAMPSRLGALLAKKTSSLERVIYFQDYIVIDPGPTPLKPRQNLTEDEYRKAREQFGDDFRAGMGAEAVKELLVNIELEPLYEDLSEELKATNSEQKRKDIIKRLKTTKALKDSENRPDWMILDVIPVIPPDLRPLVLLESGNFATSDLNDLYRRLINRNNRLKKLLDLNAPEVIIRNEKRMLQQSVDALFDNNRCRRPVLGSNSRPLKSLSDMIKGKQGRFRENLLGKRVDYSARSVIVVGPELKLHQCGLPKKIALELYQPFIIRRLKEIQLADTIKSAKKMLERKDEEVWDILEEVIREHPVLLNRAPTLHRMGIQAFEPVLIEGNAIRLHPLVCAGFNADFDGDQMAVHLPLSFEAQIEATSLMLSTNNIFSPANGAPVIAPSQDIVLGCHYLTNELAGEPGEGVPFANFFEVHMAAGEVPRKAGEDIVKNARGELDRGRIVTLHSKIKLRMPPGSKVKEFSGGSSVLMDVDETGRVIRDGKPELLITTPGRVIFNDILPEGLYYYNSTLKKSSLSEIISDCHRVLTRDATLDLLDDLKELGFKHATLAGLSFSTSDLRLPESKPEIIASTEGEVEKIQKNFQKGVITEGERYNQIIDKWQLATEAVGEAMMQNLRSDVRDGMPYLNPIFLMTGSGARGSQQQVRQLAGMRGLMAKPSGKIIETPIKANFREGLRVLEYFSSTHGARKGLADTALKTADSGYLTRKLADVAQNVVINDPDCGTLGGITKGAVFKGDEIEVPFWKVIRGRTARDNVVNVITDDAIVRENDLITEEKAHQIEEALGNRGKVRVRSPLTCESGRGVCARCYGMDLSTGREVEPGLAVGIIAAQSIGEPGTQLTMRTFHIGGIAHKVREDPEIRARLEWFNQFDELTPRFSNLETAIDKDGKLVALGNKGEVVITGSKKRRSASAERASISRDIEVYKVPEGAEICVEEGKALKPEGGKTRKKAPIIIRWDPFMKPIMATKDGFASYEDIIEGVTMRLETNAQTGVVSKVIMEHRGDHHPQILIKDKDGHTISSYPIPEKAYLEVEDGEKVTRGTRLAKTPKEIVGTQDITGGLPRVTELFEVRKPKNPAVLSEIDGYVNIGEKKRGKRTILVRSESGVEKPHLIPPGKHIIRHTGDYVKAGEALVAGPLIPQDILKISGEEDVQQYLLLEIQKVYRSQNVTIDDKHIENILAQMMRRVRVEDSGDTDFLQRDIVDKFTFRKANEQTLADGGKPATAKPLLLGITKASLYSDSFISAASFQETTKVLTEAALTGKVDDLVGLKENVILGHMVPAGTGFRAYHVKVVEKTMPEPEEIPEDALGLTGPAA